MSCSDAILQGADSSKVVKLTEGKTAEVEIVVTAEDGTSTKTYTVLMRRLSADDATLAQLDVSAGALQPPFSPLVTRYECSLPSSVDTLSLRVKTEDVKMSVSMKDGSPVETVQLNPGNTLVEINVTSVSGKTTSTYTVTVMKNRLPPTLQLKGENSAFECAVCCNVVHLPSRIKGNSHLYCSACLEELTRTNKTDPFTGKRLDEEGWLHSDLACDTDLATQMAVCRTASSAVEATMQQIGAKLSAERLKASKAEEVGTFFIHVILFVIYYNVFCSQLSHVQIAARRFLLKTLLCIRKCYAHLNTPSLFLRQR